LTKFIVTSCLVSDCMKPRPNLELVRFIKSADVAITFPTCLDVERGIVWIGKTNPAKAATIRELFSRLMSETGFLDGMSAETARIFASMLACKKLNGLWMPNKHAKYPGIGTSLMTAALSIAHAIPIATVNQSVFLEIAAYFELPGVYDPSADRWLVPHSGVDVIDT
jgi:predicted nucleic acid-binding protein